MSSQPTTIEDKLFGPEAKAQRLNEAAYALGSLLGFGDYVGEDLAKAIYERVVNISGKEKKSLQWSILHAQSIRLSEAIEELTRIKTNVAADENGVSW